MRIGIGRIASESSSFCTKPTNMESLRINGIFRGQAVLEDPRSREHFTPFLDVLGDQDLVGILSAHAAPEGLLTEEAMHTILEWFIEDLKKALPLDGLLLSMHGAFGGVADPDVEGLFLERTRQIVGDDVVIAASMDFHGNITLRKIENANIIRGYKTHPHVDAKETRKKTAEMFIAALRGEARPVMSAVKIPMITPCETEITEGEGLGYHMRELKEASIKQEEDERVLGSSFFGSWPMLDIPEMGWCTVVVTDDDQQLADQLARDLAELCWNQREEYIQPIPTYVEALDEAFSTDIQPIVISDFGDMVTGGGTGDSTWYLKEFLSREPQEPCYLTMVDPQAVKSMAEAGVGAEVTLMLGGKQDNIHSTPVEVTGRVLWVLPSSPVRILPERMGLTAVLQIGNLYVVVMEHTGLGASPTVYSGAGLDSEKAKILIAKSSVDFREGYKSVAKFMLLGEAPGFCPNDLRSLKFENVPRPIFPLDDQRSWDSSVAPVYRGHPMR